MERRYAQPEPKSNKQVFYGRLQSWYTKEEAILTWERWTKVFAKKRWYTTNKKYIPTYSYLQEDEEELDYTWIDITYSKEEARIFRREFNDVIENLEWKIRQTEDKECLRELNDKLEMARAELSLFNNYNH